MRCRFRLLVFMIGRRGLRASAQSNRQALLRIRESFAASDRTYGSPRVVRDLRDWSVPCSENRLARLMRKAGLVARPKRRRPPFDVGTRHVIAPNILDRDFTATAPNQRWIADLTYLDTAEGWLYVAVVIDLYSRRVVGWSMQQQMTAQLVTDAMMMAIWPRRPKAASLLHHSDQGSPIHQRIDSVAAGISRHRNQLPKKSSRSHFVWQQALVFCLHHCVALTAAPLQRGSIPYGDVAACVVNDPSCLQL